MKNLFWVLVGWLIGVIVFGLIGVTALLSHARNQQKEN